MEICNIWHPAWEKVESFAFHFPFLHIRQVLLYSRNNSSVDGMLHTRHQTKAAETPAEMLLTLLLRRQAAMQELEWPQDFAIKQMISLTCMLEQINIKNLCRYKSMLLIED